MRHVEHRDARNAGHEKASTLGVPLKHGSGTRMAAVQADVVPGGRGMLCTDMSGGCFVPRELVFARRSSLLELVSLGDVKSEGVGKA